jgi:hypothetical protein
MLTHAPQAAADFFRPAARDGQTFFHLQEGIIIGRKAA